MSESKENKNNTLKFGELNVRLPEENRSGTYANLALINHSPEDFVLDFAFVEPATRQATVRSRVVLTPGHAKRLLRALQSNIQRYEQQFGEIQLHQASQQAPSSPEEIN